MKTRVFISFLLLFSVFVCSPILAQEDPRTPLEKLDAAKDKANFAYQTAKTKSDAAYKKYNETDKTREALGYAKAIAESDKSDKTEDLWNNLYVVLDHIQLDLLDLVTDAARDIILGLKNGWQLAKIKENADAIATEYEAISSQVAALENSYVTLQLETDRLWTEYQNAYRAWIALDESFYELEYNLSGPTEGIAGSQLSYDFTANKVFDAVTWYVKAPEGVTPTGPDYFVITIGEEPAVLPGTYMETDMGDFVSKTANFSYQFTDSGTYTITAVAQIVSGEEQVTDSITVTVHPKPSITFKKTVLTVYDKLEVTVIKHDLYYVNMSIEAENGFKENIGDYAGNNTLTLEKSFSSGDAGYYKVVVTVSYGSGGQQTTKHTEYILVTDD